MPFRLLLGRAYDDKGVQERLVRDSALDWTIVRPGVLVPGPATGRYKVLAEPRRWRNGFVSRADVAHFIVGELVANQFVRRPGPGDPLIRAQSPSPSQQCSAT